MRQRILTAALALAAALCVAPATAEASDGYYSYACENNTVLRIIFDEERDEARVVRFRQPTIRLQRVNAEGEPEGDEFRYVRRESHELRGDLEEVRWRVGRAEWVCRRGG